MDIDPGCYPDEAVRRIMDPSDSYHAYCKRRMQTYLSLTDCLRDCHGHPNAGLTPTGKLCNCKIEPASRYSVYGKDTTRVLRELRLDYGPSRRRRK